uniref:Uncharacterized protein n=1 Tax=Anopheles farauti TaxID=69004 RepID=A0A182Q6F7_9DIPT
MFRRREHTLRLVDRVEKGFSSTTTLTATSSTTLTPSSTKRRHPGPAFCHEHCRSVAIDLVNFLIRYQYENSHQPARSSIHALSENNDLWAYVCERHTEPITSGLIHHYVQPAPSPSFDLNETLPRAAQRRMFAEPEHCPSKPYNLGGNSRKRVNRSVTTLIDQSLGRTNLVPEAKRSNGDAW